MKMHQITMVSLEDLVKADHQYRRFKEIFDLSLVGKTLKWVESRTNYKGSVLERLVKMKMHQITLVSLEDLVKADHRYRKFKEIFDFGLVPARC